tara:strand:- start:35310 stop:36005 length:696 start_codon:yes stop_codon:yes gene_type:complete
MPSPIDICNQALAHLGDRRITRLDDDAATDDALVRYCAEFYLNARQEALAAHRWSFAKASAALNRRTDITVIGHTYAHELPTDRLRLLRLVPGSQLRDADGVAAGISYQKMGIDNFKIVDTQVWSDYEFLAIEYIRDVTNPTTWSPHFRAAVARLLASYLAGPTADNPDESTKQMRIYEEVALPNAQYYDAVQDGSGENSNHSDRLARSGSIQSRYSVQYGQSDPSDYDYF